MKCGSLVIYYTELVKGKKKIFSSISPSWRNEPNFLDYWLENNVSPKTRTKIDMVNTEDCDGKIIVTVSAVDEPYFGGSSAELNVSYECNKCGQTYYKELPKYSHDVSAWMTERLAEQGDK